MQVRSSSPAGPVLTATWPTNRFEFSDQLLLSVETNMPLDGFPSALTPTAVAVIVLPSVEIRVRTVDSNEAPVFRRLSVSVLASICLLETVSNGASVRGTGCSEPSRISLYVKLICLPSARPTLVVALTPSAKASRTIVTLLNGIGAGVYADLLMFSFHVPSELSAPNATMLATAKTMNIRMFSLPWRKLRLHSVFKNAMSARLSSTDKFSPNL